MHFMKISVDQGLLGRYRFYLGDDSEPSFSASSGYMIFKGDYANIYNSQKQKVLSLRQGEYSLWKLTKSTYLINGYKPDHAIEVKCVNYKSGYWTVNLDERHYDIYFHGRIKKSLYRNGEQVAKFGRINSEHFIIANSDEDVLFLIALFMTFKMGDSAPDEDLVLEIYDNEKDENSRWYPLR